MKFIDVRLPSLISQPEDQATQERLVQELTQDVVDSGLFKLAGSEQLTCEITYSINDYLSLLNTFSPYRRLDPSQREAVFISLREALERLGVKSLQGLFFVGSSGEQKNR